MSKRPRKKQLYVLTLVALTLVGAGAIIAVVAIHVRDTHRDNQDKTQLAQQFSKVSIPSNLRFQSSSFQIANYGADLSLGLSGQTPEWIYDYMVTGAPNLSVSLAATIAADLQRAGYTISNQKVMDDLADLGAYKNNGNVSIDITFNHTIDAANHPLSKNYTVKSVTYKVDGKERSEPVSY